MMLCYVVLVNHILYNVIRGNHLPNTTCLTQAFFKSGE